jgi:Zn-dependent peptidase ImmA (M78 family)
MSYFGHIFFIVIQNVCLYNKHEVTNLEYTYTPLEEFVKDLYSALSIATPNEIDTKDIANQLNIKLYFYDDGSTAVGNRIFIDERLTRARQWEDFGHELCHILRHHGNQLLMLDDDLLYSFMRLQESQSDNFMYQFCVPTFMLLNYKIANLLDVKAGIPFIVEKFNVTEDFAAERLNRFKRQLLQSKSDTEHRAFMESLYPKAPPYSQETNNVLKQLNLILEKKGVYR